ncbi:MAG: arsenite methyltransferase [Thermoplasmata archaeon]|nr:MAG: arsenite methyltransferase [Thermoplasmata archaeon]
MDDEDIRKAVKEGYGARARGEGGCCEPQESSCCGGGTVDPVALQSIMVGYEPEDLEILPKGANLGLGCGNPVALADLEEGETVLDLGSGPGIDCFLAARRVGPTGHVIGVDMTPDMLKLARENAADGGFENVEFREGTIEEMPVEDGTVDVIISNCVINLSPDKPQVFREAFRVLRPGGRIMVSDIVLNGELPEKVKESVYEYVSCVAGASQKPDYLRYIEEAGFHDVRIVEEASYSGYPVVSSVKVSAVKPAE